MRIKWEDFREEDGSIDILGALRTQTDKELDKDFLLFLQNIQYLQPIKSRQLAAFLVAAGCLSVE